MTDNIRIATGVLLCVAGILGMLLYPDTIEADEPQPHNWQHTVSYTVVGVGVLFIWLGVFHMEW